MNANVAARIEHLLTRSPLRAAASRRVRDRLAVLAYHTAGDGERLAEHLDHLVAACRPVSLDDVVRVQRGERELPARAVLVTFDDGYRDVLEVAAPLLHERGVPAVVFVVTGLLDTDRPFWWDEVFSLVKGRLDTIRPGLSSFALVEWLKVVPDGERLRFIEELRDGAPAPLPPAAQLRRDELRVLESMGVAVGSHTRHHRMLDQCADEVVRAEVRGAHEDLVAALGHHPRAFAYPNGNVEPAAEAELRSLGYDLAFLHDHRHTPLPAPSPLAVSRLHIDVRLTVERLQLVLSGLEPAARRLGRRDGGQVPTGPLPVL